jgi:hypothetical protein
MVEAWRPRSLRSLAALFGLVAIALIGGAGRLADRTVSASRPAQPEIAPAGADDAVSRAVGEAAMRVAIDPETGQLVPLVQEPGKLPAAESGSGPQPALPALLDRSTSGLFEEVRPDGSVKVNLQGRFMSASLARLDGDGSLQTTCAGDPEAAARFLGGAGTSPAAADSGGTDQAPEVR